MTSTLKTISRATAAAALLCIAGTASAQYNNSIELSKPSWSTEQDDPYFFIQPGWQTLDHEVPPCTFSHPKVLTNSTVTPPSIAAALVTINPKEARKLPAGKNNVTVTCGSHSATFVVDNTYPALTRPVVQFDDGDPQAMTLTVIRPPAQVAANKPVTYWIAANVPGHVLGLPQDALFLLVTHPNGSAEWKMLDSDDLHSFAFAKNQRGDEPAHTLPVDLLFAKQDLAALGALLLFAYQVGDGDLTVLDTLWNPATPTAPKGKYDMPERLYTFETLNRVRAITGVGYQQQNEALDKAAQAHANYVKVNREPSHAENPAKPGFSGVWPRDRAQAFGYPSGSGVGETLNGSASYINNLWGLLGVPLHSIVILNAYREVGVGIYPQYYTVLNHGAALPAQILAADTVAVFPCNNIQVNVQGQGYEIPLPTVLNGKPDFGYTTVALARWGHTLTVDSWVLRDAAGQVVPTVITQETGKETAALIPWNALPRTETHYTSVLKGKNNGVPFEKTCKFRTVAGRTIPMN